MLQLPYVPVASSSLRHGLRALRRTPEWTAVAVLSLAFGVGINTLIFSLIDAVLLRPFPYPDAHQLVLLWGTKNDRIRRGLSEPDLADLRSESHVFKGVSAFIGTYTPFKLDGDASQEVNATYVDPTLFSVLGVSPLRGRTFLPGEDRPGRDRVAVVSYGLWVTQYASSPEIVGRTIRLDGEPYTVVGVMPPGFFFPDMSGQVWIPLSPSKWGDLSVRGRPLVQGVGRLKPGMTLAQGQSDADTIARRLQLAYPAVDKGLSVGLFPLYSVVVGKYHTALWTLMGAVALVLLIACANVASLLLGRAVEREKELAVRVALGASRRNILGHLLTESVLLGLMGGAAGGLLAYWGIRFVRGLALTDIPRIETVQLNGDVLLFNLAVSLLTVLVFGLGPATLASRSNLNDALTRGGVTSMGAARGGLRDLLVTGEVALALVLLIGAGLLVNSFVRLARSDWGFRPRNLLVVTVQPPPWTTTSGSNQLLYVDQILSRIKLLAGVESAAMAYSVPVDWGMWQPTELAVDGRVVTNDWDRWKAALFHVGPGYFRTLGIPLVAGREFTSHDDRAAAPVVIISKALADRLWRGADAIGKHLQLANLTRRNPTAKLEYRVLPPREVVGIVGSVRMFGLDEARPPALYLSIGQEAISGVEIKIVFRTTGDPAKLAETAKAEVMDVDSAAIIRRATTMEDLLRQSIGGRGSSKLTVVVSLMFGSLALLLAVVGLYGLISYAVSRRRQEFGVRMAFGAAPSDVVGLVLRHAMRLVAFGTALGLAGTWALTRLLSNFLFGVKPTDPITIIGVVILLAAVQLLACLVPAWRATQSDPALTLRYE